MQKNTFIEKYNFRKSWFERQAKCMYICIVKRDNLFVK